MKKSPKAKTKKNPKKAAAKPAARASKASTKKPTGDKQAPTAAKRDGSPTTMGWGWPAFRYPLQ
jgi:hypothetical protein